MIGVKGQYILTISLADKQDFISESDLLLFKIQEETGNVLPRFELDFLTSDTTLMPLLNEGNTISVTLGADINDADKIEAKLRIVKPTINKDSQGEISVHLLGVYDNPAYISNPGIQVTDKLTGLQVVSKFASENWQVDAEPTQSDDVPVIWSKQFITNKNMVDKALTHLYFENGVPICGITCNGVFTVRNSEDLKSKEPIWNFTLKPEKNNDISYNPNQLTTDDSSLNNNISNYGRSVRVFDVTTGTSKIVEYKANTQLSQADELPRAKEVVLLPATSEYLTENTHPDFILAKMKNETELRSLSSVKTTLSVSRGYFPIKVTQPVSFIESDINQNKRLTDNKTSGLRIVSKVCRIVTNRQFFTYIEMVCESTNEREGEFSESAGIEAIESSLTAEISALETPLKNGQSSIIDKTINSIGDTYHSITGPIEEAIRSIPLPPNMDITEQNSILSKINDLCFNVQTIISKNIINTVDITARLNEALSDNILESLTGVVSAYVNSISNYRESPLSQSARNTIQNVKETIEYSKENATLIYNSPSSLKEIPKTVINTKMRELALTIDNIKNMVSNQLNIGVKSNISALMDSYTNSVSHALNEQLQTSLSGIDPDYAANILLTSDNTTKATLNNTKNELLISVDQDLSSIQKEIENVTDNCINALISGGDLHSRFPTSVKPGNMSPSDRTEVWRCDPI